MTGDRKDLYRKHFYTESEMPLNKWRKADIIYMAERYLREATGKQPKGYRLLVKAPVQMLKMLLLKPCEPGSELYVIDPEAVKGLKDSVLREYLSNGMHVKARCTLWGGTIERPKAEAVVAKGILKGSMFSSYDGSITVNSNKSSVEILEYYPDGKEEE